MQQLDLRPLTLGEILDRTFSLYRRHFILFLGIAAIPNLLSLVFRLAQIPFQHVQPLGRSGGVLAPSSNSITAIGGGGILIGAFVFLIAYLFAQGATIYAVSDLYLGRQTTISESLKKMWGQLFNLFVVSLLNGLVIIVATIFLIIPGIYMSCRLITCVPAALLEDLGARESLERSFALTKDSAGRGFVIYFLYFCMLYATGLLFAIPFGLALYFYGKDPTMVRAATALMDVGDFCSGALIAPFFLIATSVFYYDLRVRKEAFDLQWMMNPGGTRPVGGSSVPSILA